MVKGNKFKTADFLEKQALKAKSKLPLPAAVSAPGRSTSPHTTVNNDAQAPALLAQSQQDKPAAKQPQHKLAKSGTKRKASSEALTEVLNTSSASASATEPSALTGEINKKRKPKTQQQEPATDAAQALPVSAASAAKNRKQVKSALPTILAAPAPQGKAVNSNWAALKGIVASSAHRRQPAKGNPASDRPPVLKAPQQLSMRAGLTPVVAIDCEMVGVGPDGTRSALARVCMVNNDGGVLIDQYVQPQEKVTDYRTFVSGIEPKHLKQGAVSLSDAQKMVANILTGRILVGHAVHHDLQALLLSHPRKMTRDTATYAPLMMSIGKGQKAKPRSLRHLAETELGLSIQAGEHSPVDDARSTLYLYHKHRKDWERHLQQGTLKDLAAPRLLKKIVLQQVEAAAAAGVDVDIIKRPSDGKKRPSLARLAEHDDMVDL